MQCVCMFVCVYINVLRWATYDFISPDFNTLLDFLTLQANSKNIQAISFDYARSSSKSRDFANN